MKVFLLACSLRRESIHKRLARHTAGALTALGCDVDHAELNDFPLPLFDQDIIDGEGFPAASDALRDRFLAAPAFVLVTPEYNYSVAAPTKNFIDWLSRYRPKPFAGKLGYLAASSNGVIGGIRGLWQTRVPLEGCGAVLWPDMFALPEGEKHLVGDALPEGPLASRLATSLAGWVAFAKKAGG